MISVMDAMHSHLTYALSEVARWIVSEPVAMIFVGLGVLCFAFDIFRKVVG